MSPEHTLRGWFGHQRRMRNRWARAVNDPDTERSLERMRDVLHVIARQPADHARMWLPFLASMTGDRFLPLLTDDDFLRMRHAGTKLVGARARVREDGDGPDHAATLANTWLPLVRARDARGEPEQSTKLLTLLYRSEFADGHSRSVAAGELIRRRALGEEEMPVYADLLSRGQEAERVTELLTPVLSVDFDDSEATLARAARCADVLVHAGIRLPGRDTARGLHALVVNGDPDRTVHYLTTDSQDDHRDEVALTALLTAWLRLGEYARVATWKEPRRRPPSRRVTELVHLGAALHWLDDSEATGPPPRTADQLSGFTVAAQAGELLEYAVARTYLVEGATTRAAALLPALADAHPGRLDWEYHAAWALLLRGDGDGVAERYRRVRKAHAAWAMGCLVLDIAPDHEVANDVARALTSAPRSYSDVARARLAMARGERATTRAERATPHATGPERLEALRTRMGLAFAEGDEIALASMVDSASFQRLPAPDRLLWSGLALLRSEPVRGRALLEKAARTHGYGRAALVLAAHDAESRSFACAADRLDQHEVRPGTKASLLLLWARAQTGRRRLSEIDLEPMARQGVPQALYVKAIARLRKAITQRREDMIGDDAWSRLLKQAAEDLIDVAEEGHGAMSAAAPAYAWAARALRGDRASDPPPTPEDTPWVAWILDMASVDPDAAEPSTCARLLNLLHTVERPHPSAVTALAAVLARSCAAATDSTRALAFLDLLKDLANLCADDLEPVRRAHLTATVSVLRRWPHEADQPIELPPDASGSVLLVLAATERALGRGARADAVRLLRGVRRLDAEERRLRDALLFALVGEGEAPPTEGLAPVLGLAVQVRQATALADGDQRRCVDVLARVLPAAGARAAARLADLDRVLPVLCATHRDAARSGSSPLALLVMDLATTEGNPVSDLTLARCATALGDVETADALWPSADTTARDRAGVGAEYARYMCHRAHQARMGDQAMVAARYLSTAATLLERGQRPEEPTATTRRRAPLPGPGQLRALARDLELEACVSRLLHHLFPNAPGPAPERPGRYRALESAITRNRPLRKALTNGDDHATKRAWNAALDGSGGDVALTHTLAVLYRERALEQFARTRSTDTLLETATALWTVLLSSAAFWTSVGEPGDEVELRARICEELFALHRSQGVNALTAVQSARAKQHAHCLKACGEDTPESVQALSWPLGSSIEVDPSRFREASRLAGTQLEGWCDEAVRDATRLAEDPEAIALLPPGIKLDYEMAIARLIPLLDLDVASVRFLSQGLRWHNDWWLDLYRQDEGDALRQVLSSAERFAHQLAPLSVAGRGHERSNQELSEYHKFCGYTSRGYEAVREYEVALEWNPANDNGTQLLAFALLDIARDLFTEGQYTKALAHAHKAQKTWPATANVEEFIREVSQHLHEELSPWELEEGTTALGRGQYDPADHATGQASSSSEESPEARRIQVLDLSEQGVSKADHAHRASRGRGAIGTNRFLGLAPVHPQFAEMVLDALHSSFAPAERDLRQALRLAEHPDDRVLVRQRRASVLNLQAVFLLDSVDAAPPHRTSQVTALLDRARSLLTQAASLNPGDPAIDTNHRYLRKIKNR